MIKKTTPKKAGKLIGVNLYQESIEAPKTTLAPQVDVDQEKPFYNVPVSPASDYYMKALTSGANIADLPARSDLINHNTKVEVFEKGKKRQIELTSNKAKLTLEISDIDKLIGSNKSAKKMFVFSLIKMNEQSNKNGVLFKNSIGFPLQELVDIGNYKRIQSARKGFDRATDILTSIKIKGKLKISGKKSIDQEGLEVLFTGANRNNGYCTIFLNERINWSFLSQFYTILPRYAFSLPSKAFDLLYCIFYLARQNTEKIKNQSYFTISFRTIQQRLNLPSEINNKDPQRTIKDPIESAITAIEEKNQDIEFTMTPIYEEKASIKDFLNKGYLKIGLKGKYANDFIAIAEEKGKLIQSAKKRKEAVIDKAKALNMANNMKDTQKTE